MTLYACSIHHKTASVAIREKVAVQPEQLDAALTALTALPDVHEALILSTCNRMEIYAVAPQADVIKQWVAQYFNLSAEALSQAWLTFEDANAVRHALRVASGLDSMVIGETEILGQLKQAFVKASYVGSIGPYLERLFSRVFQVAKKIRTSNAIGACPVSLASMSVALVKQKIPNITSKKVLVIGTGETATLVVRHLFADNIKNLLIAGRHVEKALFLTEQFSGRAIALDQLYEFLPEADVVISATASSLPIVTYHALENVLPDKPMLFVDVAVPRDIEADVAQYETVSLYNIDDLKSLIDSNKRTRTHAANQAEIVIKQEVNVYLKWISALEAGSIISAYRTHVESLAEQALQKTKAALDKGLPAEDALRTLAKQLTQQFLHKPSVNMRKASEQGRLAYLELLYELFELDV